MVILKVIGIIVIIFVVLFVLSLFIYFLNLDMKMAAKMIPFMTKHYDRAKEKRDAKAEKNETI